jgi:hypothetical protein
MRLDARVGSEWRQSSLVEESVMATTANRTRANRANAQKSTGPRTASGRARSSLNRLLHGLRASTPVLPGEDPRELEALTRTVASEMRAQGALEAFMVERVAVGMWRLLRAERAELGILAERLLEVERDRSIQLRERCEADPFEHLMARNASITDPTGHLEATTQLAEIESADEGDVPTLGQALKRDATGSGSIELALRYRTATERSLFRTLRELRDFRAARTRS